MHFWYNERGSDTAKEKEIVIIIIIIITKMYFLNAVINLERVTSPNCICI
jgi:hypothetical protein